MAVNAWRATTDSNFGTATNWTQGTVPTISDGHTTTFDASSPNCTINASNRACNNLDFTGFPNVLTFTFSFTCGGNVNFTGMTNARTAGAGTLTINTTSAITGGGATFGQSLLFSSTTTTKTLTGTLTVTGLFTSSTSTQTANGGTLILNGGINMVGIMGGTTAITLGGGTWSGASALQNNLTFAGNSTVSGSVAFSTGVLTHTSGAVTTTSSTITISASATLNVSGITWNAVTFSGVGTYTLSSILNMSGTLFYSGGVTFTMAGAFDINCGNLQMTSTNAILVLAGNINSSGTVSSGGSGSSTWNGAFNINCSGSVTVGAWGGTATFVVTGTGTFAGVTGASFIANNVTFNTVGTITFGSFTYRTGTVLFTAIGTMVWGATIIIVNTGSPTITANISGIAIPTLTVGNGLSMSTLTINGTNGISVGNLIFTSTTANATINWKSTNTYSITSAITVTGTLLVKMKFVSSVGGSKAIITLVNGASQDIDFLDATDIDSSLGATFWSYKGVITTCSNWNLMPTQPATVGYAYMN